MHGHRFHETLDHFCCDDDFASYCGLRTRKSLISRITLVLKNLDAISEAVVKLSRRVERLRMGYPPGYRKTTNLIASLRATA